MIYLDSSALVKLALTEPEYALGYRFDVVLRGRNATPFEDKEQN